MVQSLDRIELNREVPFFPTALNRQRDGLAGALHYLIAQLGKRIQLLAIEGHNNIALLHAGLSSGAFTCTLFQFLVRLLIGRAGHLAHARAHVSIRVGQAGRHRHKVKDDKAQDQVDADAAGHHDYALPPRLFIHGMGLFFLGEEFILGRHASDIAKPAYREGRKPIFRVALPEGK